MIILKQFTRTNKYILNEEAANETLQNIFASCNRQPNTIPFDKILLRQKANTAVYVSGIVLSCVLFTIVLLVPCLTL